MNLYIRDYHGHYRQATQLELKQAHDTIKDAPLPEQLTSSYETFAYCQATFAHLTELKQEEMHVLTLDTKNRPIATHMVTRGTLNASLVHPREMFRLAISDSAASIVLVHNHPSGDPSPSKEDRKVTESIRNAGEIIGIALLDHIVIATQGCESASGL